MVVKIKFGVEEDTKVLDRVGACNDKMTEAIIVRRKVSLPGIRHDPHLITV
jgi:hypothetical protein